MLTRDPAQQYVLKSKRSDDVDTNDVLQKQSDSFELGWTVPEDKSKFTKRRKPSAEEETSRQSEQEERATQHRRRLLKELSARLARDTQLRYAEREFEMQKSLMGKGGRLKLRGVERIGVDGNDKEDEDEADARGGRPLKTSRKAVDEKVWKPRVYKWKIERKR
jgi:U3 small nucleolar RNA-associated protein 11